MKQPALDREDLEAIAHLELWRLAGKELSDGRSARNWYIDSDEYFAHPGDWYVNIEQQERPRPPVDFEATALKLSVAIDRVLECWRDHEQTSEAYKSKP